jgi:PAS domain-containing protein
MIHGLERVIHIQRETAEQLRDEIAERKRGAAALRQSELKYREIFDNIQVFTTRPALMVPSWKSARRPAKSQHMRARS